MKSPFIKQEVTLKLSIADFGILLSCLRRSIPEGKNEEDAVVSLSQQLVDKLNELEND